ncbi:MAG: biotin/lipoyl-binding protein, partial [Acidimicrobiales bacterium]|nr:biotin/lipoyl-binding protein [Acidimicrobiales bacterium]
MKRFSSYLRSPWVIMPLVAALAFGGWFTFLRSDATEAAETPAATVVEATVGTMSRTVSADGTIAAAESEDLSFGSSGTVTAVHVEAGDTVTAGQVLAEIDSAELQASVASAEATLADAQAKLADDVDADASDEQLAADESSVSSAQDALDAADEALEGATLVATIDGTVASVAITEGEQLGDGGQGGVDATGSGSGSGASAGTLGSSSQVPGTGGTGSTDSSTTDGADISISSTGRYVVQLGFDDTDIANVEVGQLATVGLSSSTSTGFPGGDGFPGGGFGGVGATTDQADDEADSTEEVPEVAALGADQTSGPEGFVTEVGAVADASSGVASYPVTVAFADDSGEY